jgi:hypothetical protein
MRAFVAVLAVGVLTPFSTLSAQEGSPVEPHWGTAGTLLALDDYRWIVEGGVAAASIHGTSYENIGLHGRILRSLDETGHMGLETMFLGALGGETGFLSLDVGLRLRPIPDGEFSPFVGGAAGVGTCFEWVGLVVRGYGGFEVRLKPRLALTAAFQFGSHGGDEGPSAFTVGLAHRLGSRH